VKKFNAAAKAEKKADDAAKVEAKAEIKAVDSCASIDPDAAGDAAAACSFAEAACKAASIDDAFVSLMRVIMPTLSPSVRANTIFFHCCCLFRFYIEN